MPSRAWAAVLLSTVLPQPISTPDGSLGEREATLEGILQQQKELTLQMKAYKSNRVPGAPHAKSCGSHRAGPDAGLPGEGGGGLGKQTPPPHHVQGPRMPGKQPGGWPPAARTRTSAAQLLDPVSDPRGQGHPAGAALDTPTPAPRPALHCVCRTRGPRGAQPTQEHCACALALNSLSNAAPGSPLRTRVGVGVQVIRQADGQTSAHLRPNKWAWTQVGGKVWTQTA